MSTFSLNKILIPIDFSPLSLDTLRIANELASRSKAELVLLHVVHDVTTAYPEFYYASSLRPEYRNDLESASINELDKLAADIKRNGAPKVSVMANEGRIYDRIVHTAREIHADLILMSTHGVSGYKEVFVGSNTQRVVTLSEIPVLSMQSGASKEFKNILVPIDDSPHSRSKTNAALKLAKLYSSKIHILGLAPSDEKEDLAKFRIKVNSVEEAIKADHLDFVTTIEQGDNLAEVAMEYGKKNSCDLIVINTGHESRTTGIFLGTFAQQIVNHSKIPVLSIIPEPEHYVIETPGMGIS